LDSLLETVTALASARALDHVIRIVRSSASELTQADGVSFVPKEDGNVREDDPIGAIGAYWLQPHEATLQSNRYSGRGRLRICWISRAPPPDCCNSTPGIPVIH
jgi:hypothetical protein